MADEQKIDFSTLSEKAGGKVVYLTDDPITYDDFVDEWKANHDDDEPAPEDGSDEFYRGVEHAKERDWEDFKENFEYSPLMGKHVLIHGYFGAWDGRRDGGKVLEVKGVETLLAPVVSSSTSSVELWIDKDGLQLENAHHDGTSRYTIDLLTEEGEKYWYEHETDTKEVHDHLLKTEGLTRKIDFYLF